MADGLPLIGPVGVEFLTDALTTRNPKDAIQLMQNKAAMDHPGCGPVLQLLDQLSISRLRAHQYVVNEATQRIVDRIRAIQKSSKEGEKDEVVEQLLQASFPYLGITALRMVPIAAMEAMKEVPHQFLRQLGHDKDVFDHLPQRVKRQVWENDKKLLQKHAGEQIDAYKYETATIMRALAMDDPLPAAAPPGAGSSSAGKGRTPPVRPPPSRKMLRNASAAMQRLRDIVGTSRKLYSLTVELIAAKLRDSEPLYCGVHQDALCAARSQLLMALHDRGDMAGRDVLHQLAWTLDACIAHRTLEERHLATIRKFFRPYEGSSRGGGGSSSRHGGSGRHGGGQGGRRRHPSSDDENASSAGGESMAGGEPQKVLGEAGMVLRDPPVMHLLAHHVARRLQAAAQAATLPRDDEEITWVTRLLQLAAECRQMLRQQTFHFPAAPDDLLRALYPTLTSYLVDAILRKEGMQVEVAEPHKEYVVEVLSFSEAGRKVTQALVLQRLVAGDLDTTLLLLRALSQVLEASQKAAHEMGPFAATLAARLAGMVSVGKLGPKDDLWVTSMEGVLLLCVDTDTQVHEEVLRLLLLCAPKLPPAQVGSYLQTALELSRKSRQRFTKRRKSAPDLGAYPGLESFGSHPGFDFSDAGSDRTDYVRSAKHKEADGVRAVYRMFADKVPGLDPDTAPALFAYLQAV